MPSHGAVDLGTDTHEYKKVIKEKLGGNEGIGDLLQSKGQTNFDFWVAKDGTIWISDNGEGGQGVETDQNFFDLFPEFMPEQDVPDQDRAFHLPSDDDYDQPQPGEIYEADDGRSYFVAANGRSYAVQVDSSGNSYYADENGDTHWAQL